MLQVPLSTVEIACSALEQEETHLSLLCLDKSGGDLMAMYSKSNQEKCVVCTVCGMKCHHQEKCW